MRQSALRPDVRRHRHVAARTAHRPTVFADTHRWSLPVARRFGYYVSDHSVRLPHEVVPHAIDRLDTLDSTESSLDWWLQQTRTT